MRGALRWFFLTPVHTPFTLLVFCTIASALSR